MFKGDLNLSLLSERTGEFIVEVKKSMPFWHNFFVEKIWFYFLHSELIFENDDRNRMNGKTRAFFGVTLVAACGENMTG